MTKYLAGLFSTVMLLPALERQNPPALAPTWSGIITLPIQFPGKKKPVASPLTVIRDVTAYEKFLNRIPKKQISRTRPAPPNKDPLLKQPKVDFTKHSLLLVERPSLTSPIFRKLERAPKETVVTVTFPRNQPLARPIHIGCYAALLVPKIDGRVRLNLVK